MDLFDNPVEQKQAVLFSGSYVFALMLFIPVDRALLQLRYNSILLT